MTCNHFNEFENLADEDESMTAKRALRKSAAPSDIEAVLPDNLEDPGQLGPRSAGRSGDNQGLPREESSTTESVEELNDTDQGLEAGIVEGVEEAADHPEEPVPDPEKHYRHKR
jgi:hypothetical protein